MIGLLIALLFYVQNYSNEEKVLKNKKAGLVVFLLALIIILIPVSIIYSQIDKTEEVDITESSTNFIDASILATEFENIQIQLRNLDTTNEKYLDATKEALMIEINEIQKTKEAMRNSTIILTVKVEEAIETEIFATQRSSIDGMTQNYIPEGEFFFRFHRRRFIC